MLAESANRHAVNGGLAQRIRDLEGRRSEILGQQVFERSGLGAPTATAALQDELEHYKQLVLDLTSRSEDSTKVGAARGANRGLIAELSRP
jgi:hypothetical protein